MNMDKFTYHTIEESGTAEFKDRGSRFLAFTFPVTDEAECKSRLQEIKKAHPSATHHCFAWRLGTDGLRFRASDAGEPSGSAGKPILGQIDRLAVTDVLVIVVRYFGGTLLGIPGLIHAYKSAAALALQTTARVSRNLERRYSLDFDYTVMNDVMQIIRRFHCTIHSRQSTLFCNIEAGIPLERLDDCVNMFGDVSGLKIEAV